MSQNAGAFLFSRCGRDLRTYLKKCFLRYVNLNSITYLLKSKNSFSVSKKAASHETASVIISRCTAVRMFPVRSLRKLQAMPA